MKLDLNHNYKNLDGNDLPDGNIGQQVAKILCGTTPGIEPIKAFDWALQLNKEGFLEIDRADLKNLTKFIESTEALTNLAKAQLLKLCDIKK